MNTNQLTFISQATAAHRPAIVALLQEEKLPTADLPPVLEHYFVASEDSYIIGAVGLEVYGSCGLLRSLVVHKEHRGRQTAGQLVQALEAHAQQLGIGALYLLTETAPGYFEKKGFRRIGREEVPETVRASSEFSHVCPSSALVMKKRLS